MAWLSGVARRPAVALITLLALAVLTVRLSAHVVPVEQTVEMFVQPQGDQLIVLLRLPTTVLSDADLPRLANGDLDLSAMDGPLRLVAAEVAGNLEMRQAGVTLSRPTATAVASRSADTSFATLATALAHLAAVNTAQPIAEQEAFVDLELIYPAHGGGRLSARLNAFQTRGRPVRTVAHFVLPSGQQQTVSVAGPPERVAFDPDSIEAAKQFVGRGLQALLGGGDHLLWLCCLVVPVRRARTVGALFAAGALGQLATSAASAFQVPLTADWLGAAELIAASAIVMAALQNIAGAHLRWVRPLVLAFGALNGFTFGNHLATAGPFAGAHAVLAVVIFLLVVGIGQLWIGALLWSIRAWLNERGLPEGVATVVLSALIAHSAVHRVLERGQALALGSGQVLLVLTLGWASVMLLVSLVEALAGRRVHPLDPARVGRSTSAPS